jgi:hypothetical protein
MTEELKCACCSGEDCCCGPTAEQLATMKQWEKEMVTKYGFYIHYVPDRLYVDCHTHGLRDSLGHPELQIVASIPGNIAMGIMHNVVDKIREGHELKDQEKLDQIIETFPILIAKMKDREGAEYFRIIFPDADGRFPDDEDCSPFFKAQVLEDLVW